MCTHWLSIYVTYLKFQRTNDTFSVILTKSNELHNALGYLRHGKFRFVPILESIDWCLVQKAHDSDNVTSTVSIQTHGCRQNDFIFFL